MTYYDLEDKHFDIWCEDTGVSNMAAHTKISIEYAISVLEKVANPDYQIISDGQCGVISIPQSSIYDKIKELKSLIK